MQGMTRRERQITDETQIMDILDKGKVLGIVGESGSGKSVTAYSILQILTHPGKIVSGSIKFHGKELTLHDCVADKITFENKTLRFVLPDGFWVTTHHEVNSSEKTVRTDASVVDFAIADIDDITIHVFTRNSWCWSRKTIVETWHMEELISAVNSGKCIIEFITQYRSYYEQLWHCVIRSDKKPFYRECHLHLPNTMATFYWNNLRLDHEW